jgi:predicted nucleic acid-binding protein
MPGNNTLYYWDSCLFLAWLKDEKRPTGEMDGVREVIQRAKRREVKIMTSVLTLTEVLAGSIPAGVQTLFSDTLRRTLRCGVDLKVARLAHDLRDHYAKLGGKTLCTPDAIHLATAILHRADEFHTFDAGGQSTKSLGLIGLSGNIAGHKLIICKPEAKNPELDLRKP